MNRVGRTGLVVTAAGALLLQAGCAASPAPASGQRSSVPPAASASPTPTTSATVGAAAAATPAPTGRAAGPAPSPTVVAASTASGGCTNGRTTIPAGSSSRTIGDVDGDGRRDTVFLSRSAPWLIGVRTAAGGVYTLSDQLPRGAAHTAWAANTDGAPGSVVVVDDGAAATVQAFRSCRFVRIDGGSGGPLVLPVGGSRGVACNDRNGGVLLEASRTVRRADGRVDVAWSTLDGVDSLNRAHFAAPETRWSDLPATDPRVVRSSTSSCWASSGTVQSPKA